MRSEISILEPERAVCWKKRTASGGNKSAGFEARVRAATSIVLLSCFFPSQHEVQARARTKNGINCNCRNAFANWRILIYVSKQRRDAALAQEGG